MAAAAAPAAAADAGRPPVAWLPASWSLGLLTLLLAVTTFVGENVPDSYMDEPFHVPMAQLYCRGDFLTWDPKITTFPGLYLLGAGYAWLSHLALGWAGLSLEFACSGPYLRSLNALLTVATIQVAYAVSMELQRQHKGPTTSSSSRNGTTAQPKAQQAEQEQQRKAAACVALVVGLLPTQFFFSFLFYTDVPSLLFVLLTELLLRRRNTYAAAAAGAAAIGMRQTNAVWVAFLTGAAMLQELLAAAPFAGTGGSSSSNSSSRAKQQQQQQLAKQWRKLPELLALLLQAWQLRTRLLRGFWLLLLLPVAFCAFVVVNGGITLGDREAHAPKSHMMQPLYFGLFAGVAAWPLLLQPAVTVRLQRGCRAAPRLLLLAALAAAGAAAAALVARYSLAHPYLLADNRHYTFYIWRRLFARHWVLRFGLVPLYVGAWLLLLAGLGVRQHWLWVAAFAASCWVTLAPAWLLELRYFTTPLCLSALHLPLPTDRTGLMMLLAGFCAVNASTLWVFAKRPFTWGDGSVARFMW